MFFEKKVLYLHKHSLYRMAEKAKINCPVCKGVGQIVAPKPSEDIGKKVRAAKELKKAGFSFREIMKFMNYKSTRSVSYLFEK